MMKTVDYLPEIRETAKARALLDALDQAGAYYTPEPLPEAKTDQPANGFVPYYDAA